MISVHIISFDTVIHKQIMNHLPIYLIEKFSNIHRSMIKKIPNHLLYRRYRVHSIKVERRQRSPLIRHLPRSIMQMINTASLFLFVRCRYGPMIYAADCRLDSRHVARPSRFVAGSTRQTNENAHCISIAFAPDRGNNGDN